MRSVIATIAFGTLLFGQSTLASHQGERLRDIETEVFSFPDGSRTSTITASESLATSALHTTSLKHRTRHPKTRNSTATRTRSSFASGGLPTSTMFQYGNCSSPQETAYTTVSGIALGTAAGTGHPTAYGSGTGTAEASTITLASMVIVIPAGASNACNATYHAPTLAPTTTVEPAASKQASEPPKGQPSGTPPAGPEPTPTPSDRFNSAAPGGVWSGSWMWTGIGVLVAGVGAMV